MLLKLYILPVSIYQKNHCVTLWMLGGNANLKYFMDGLPETVEVVIYQSYESQKNRTDDYLYDKTKKAIST